MSKIEISTRVSYITRDFFMCMLQEIASPLCSLQQGGQKLMHPSKKNSFVCYLADSESDFL